MQEKMRFEKIIGPDYTLIFREPLEVEYKYSAGYYEINRNDLLILATGDTLGELRKDFESQFLNVWQVFMEEESILNDSNIRFIVGLKIRLGRTIIKENN